MRLLAAALVSTSALLAPRAPPAHRRRPRTTHRHALDADRHAVDADAQAPCDAIEACDTRGATPARAADVPHVGRRAAVAAFALALAAPAQAEMQETLNWAGGTPFSATAKRIVDAYYGLEFTVYLSRFLLNFDADCASWWAQQEAAVPSSYDKKRRSAFLAAKFATFESSVEYGLRRYPGNAGRKALLTKLTQQHGFDAERRRHLALAFTLLAPERQPVTGIKELLIDVPVYGKSGGGGVGALLPPAFSPGLADYLYADPLALLPRTQLPVLNASRHYEIRGLAPVLASTSEVFGRRGQKGATIERSLDLQTYASFAVAGLVGCAATHAVLVPIDVVKTRQQTESDSMSLSASALRIYEDEGLSALFLGAAPTLAGYCYYGLTVYPGYEYWSRMLSSIVTSAQAIEYRAAIVLLAGALATLVACIGVCPAEALRIRVVADPSRFEGDNLVGMAQRVSREEGSYSVLYNGFRPLVVRQVIFGMVKFFFFDSLADAIFYQIPSLEATVTSRLFVSLVAGLAAGTASSLVSQPADAVLSRINVRGGAYPVLEAFRDILDEAGPGGFYKGALARCVWSGLVISGQFAIYDVCKSLFAVAGPDLTLHLDLAF